MRRIMVLFLFCCCGSTTSAGAQLTSPRELPPCTTVDDWNAPGAVRVGETSEGLRVSWLPSPRMPADIEGFEIARSTETAGPYFSLAIVHNTVTEYVDSAAAPDTYYWYQVRAFKEGLCSPFSDPVRGMR